MKIIPASRNRAPLNSDIVWPREPGIRFFQQESASLKGFHQSRHLGEEMENAAGVDEDHPVLEIAGVLFQLRDQAQQGLASVDRVQNQTLQPGHLGDELQLLGAAQGITGALVTVDKPESVFPDRG